MPNLVNVVNDFPFSGYTNVQGLSFTENSMYINSALNYGLPSDEPLPADEMYNLTPQELLLPLAQQEAIRQTQDAITKSAKYAVAQSTKKYVAGKLITRCFGTSLTLITTGLEMYQTIQMALEVEEAKRKMDYDMQKFNVVCTVNESNFNFKAKYVGNSRDFKVNNVRFQLGMTNELLYQTSRRPPSTIRYEMVDALMIWAPDLDDEIEYEYKRFIQPITWNLFDQFIIGKLSVNWSDTYVGQLTRIPINGNVIASAFTKIDSPIVRATITDLWYEDNTTITIEIRAEDTTVYADKSLFPGYPVNNFSYYVGSLTDK